MGVVKVNYLPIQKVIFIDNQNFMCYEVQIGYNMIF